MTTGVCRKVVVSQDIDEHNESERRGKGRGRMKGEEKGGEKGKKKKEWGPADWVGV